VTAARVLLHVDSEMAHEKLINSRLAYVAISRASHDAQIYTNDAANLGAALSREVSNASAISFEQPAAGKERGQSRPTLDEGYWQGMSTFG
jgi:ATP-dependent exoDNAse (exonuclease V) alpha subunit